jgi:CO dehydrogenase maturation factor
MSVPAGTQAVPVSGDYNAPRADACGIRVVITGKGGVGKTTLAALLARLFALGGKRVLAIDGDPQQNLAATLGVPPDVVEQIVPVSESVDYLREKTGAGPDISPGGLLTLNPDVSDVIDRFSIPVDQNLRLLVMGSVKQAGSGCLCPEYTLLSAILRHMRLLKDEVVILDTPAGLEHFGRAVAEGFTCAVVVADPSYNAVSVARESARLAGQLGIGEVMFVLNHVQGDTDVQKVCGETGCMPAFPLTIILPFDPQVSRTEPAVTPLIAGESVFIENVRVLAATITGVCESRNPRVM